MKIAIINITGGGMSGGYKKYLQNIIPRMAKNPKIESILCAFPKSINIQDWLGSFLNVKFVNCLPFQFFFNKHDSVLIDNLEEFSPDVIFIPLERFLKFKNVPIVNMIQNMEPFVNIGDNPLIEQFRIWVRKTEGKKSFKKSKRIIVPSKYARDFLIKYCGIESDKISLVYHGKDLPEKDVRRPEIIPKELSNKFLFTAGSIRPTRGLEDLFYAFKKLSDDYSDTSFLVIAGEISPGMEGYRQRLKNWLRKHKLSSKVIWAGDLNDKEMAWCYKNCQMFVMTSQVESFGMVATEAMSYGCLCISSDSSCLPEIFNETALFYPGKNPKILTEKILETLNWSEVKKQEMRQKALRRASYFNWDKCVQQTISELEKAIY
ncbi:glycosyltransferase family 4 protein [Candidatus Parcubacteria bacterium]|nr:glycosyltransferase family 4 protein [Candidatus Parcubacteria bacterium]